MLAYFCKMEYQEAINTGLEAVKSGKIILCPTDTIWGLSCDATNDEAIDRIFALKKRDPNKSFIILINSNAMLNNCVKEIPEVVWDLVDFSTSPLSIVMDQGQYVSKKALHPNGSIAFRWIKEGYCYDLLNKFRKPIISTSPNFSGEPSPANFADVNPEIKAAVDFVVPEAYGKNMTGKASKIIKVRNNGEVEIIRK